jgi:CheY-like chemotaxis protein
VDDDAAVRERHARVLNLNGYHVETANDGAAALERCADEEFDLVVTDRAMPILDGASMALALRSAGSKIPIVMVSRSLAATSLSRKVAHEFSAMLPKPASNTQILAAVAHALHRVPWPEGVRNLPPIVPIVLAEATRRRIRCQITMGKFLDQLKRLSMEELEPRGLTLFVHNLPRGTTRFVIKRMATREVLDMFEIEPDGKGAPASNTNNRS